MDVSSTFHFLHHHKLLCLQLYRLIPYAACCSLALLLDSTFQGSTMTQDSMVDQGFCTFSKPLEADHWQKADGVMKIVYFA